MNMKEDPIQNLDEIDVLGKRKDGGVDLVIIVSSELQDTEHHRNLFMNKLQNYINEVKSDEFITEYGENNLRIITKLSVEPNKEILELFHKAKILLETLNIGFKYENV